ncbi:MAG: CHRD domain-containing protein [Phycisphaerales bacterium JB040]
MARTTAALTLSLAAGLAGADITDFTASISGASEVPPAETPATGNLTGQYDSDLNTFSFSWSITDNLIGAPASPGAHLHMGGPDENGPIVFGFNEPDGTWALSGSAVWSGLSAGEVDALFSGNIYVNFHTSEFPGGEVRGQLVPAPGAVPVAGVSLLLAARRRRAP